MNDERRGEDARHDDEMVRQAERRHAYTVQAVVRAEQRVGGVDQVVRKFRHDLTQKTRLCRAGVRVRKER